MEPHFAAYVSLIFGADTAVKSLSLPSESVWLVRQRARARASIRKHPEKRPRPPNDTSGNGGSVDTCRDPAIGGLCGLWLMQHDQNEILRSTHWKRRNERRNDGVLDIATPAR